jgi:hypothetical protein
MSRLAVFSIQSPKTVTNGTIYGSIICYMASQALQPIPEAPEKTRPSWWSNLHFHEWRKVSAIELSPRYWRFHEQCSKCDGVRYRESNAWDQAPEI